MSTHGIHRDPVLAALRELRTYDVSPTRALRLRNRCQNILEARASQGRLARSSEAVWRRAVHLLAAAWCIVYFLETVRRAAAVYGF